MPKQQPNDEALAGRIRDVLERTLGIESKRLFGGVGFLLHGNMLVCAWKGSLIVRLEPDEYEAALLEPQVRKFDITGRPMRGWVMVEPAGLAKDSQLKAWIERALAFVRTLPKK